MKKYSIDLRAHAFGVLMIRLTEYEKHQLMKERCLEDVFFDFDWDWDKSEVNEYYLTPEVDGYSLVIKDEEDEFVYESYDVSDLNDKTFDEDNEPQVKGWKFEGVREGFYLTRISAFESSWCLGDLEIEEPFDENKLYIVRDTKLDNEALVGAAVGYPVYPTCGLYYQKGEGYDMERDRIDIDYKDDRGEICWDMYLIKVEKSNFWVELRGNVLDED